MRYTIDELPYPPESSDIDTPIMVEVLSPDPTRVVRDYAGNAVGFGIGDKIDRPEFHLLGDDELIERLQPLVAALRELDDHMDATHTVHYGDGRDPEGPDEEAQIRSDLQFESLIAHAVAAVEIYTRQG